jgi:hypothetical protein
LKRIRLIWLDLYESLFSILLRNFHDTFLQIAGHSILAAILWSCARSVDLTSKAAITSFYMFIWKVSLASIPDLSFGQLPIPLSKLKTPCRVAPCPAQLNHPHDLHCTPLNES